MAAQRPSERKAPLGADFVIPGLALALALYFFVSIADLAWEAKANGLLIGTVLVVLVIVQAIRIGLQIARGNGDLRLDLLLQPYDALPKRIGLVALTAIFIAAMKWLGLTLSLFLAMLAALYLMGVRKPTRLLFVAFGAAAAAYIMFIAVLDSDFPRGPIEQLLGSLFS
jgi:hypothetical protein